MRLPPNPMQTPRVALTIAGSDNSAGAGAQADLKTFTALGVYGLTAITCVVAEIPGHVSAIAPVPPEIVAEQVRLSFSAYPVGAVKTGMLHSRAVVEAVCDVLEGERPVLVVDPVMLASSGAALLEPTGLEAFTTRLFPLATLVTPNLDETAALLGRPVSSVAEMHEAGRELVGRFGGAFLLKGGHLAGEAVDVLFTPKGDPVEFRAARLPGGSPHGTGCTFSAAITAGLACGLPLAEAVGNAKAFITRAIAQRHRWNGPRGEIQALL